MNRRVAFPFVTISSAAVSGTQWEISLDGSDWIEASDYLPGWDSSSLLRARRTIRIDPDVAASDLNLPKRQLRLAMSARIGTGHGRLPRVIVDRDRYELEANSWERSFKFELSGTNLSVALDILTDITIAAAPDTPAPLSPRSVADRLWSETIRIRLEGEEPRFPIETANFSTLLQGGVGTSAPWHLHWSPFEWNKDFHGAVRLYLNEQATDLLVRFEEHDPSTLQALLGDIMSQICERFVREPEAADMMAASESQSIGAQAATWVRKAWPGMDMEMIRSLLETRPGVFRSAILALAELGEG